jgi:acyl-CoA reductase-like NAD-dependent aldehyde dehydrogenase
MQTTISDGPHAHAAPARTGASREVVSYDPATGEELGRVPLLSHAEVEAAVARSRAAQKGWAAKTFAERAGLVLRARSLVLAELDEIAALIARETGKPVAEAVSMELVPTLDLMRYFARRTRTLLKPEKLDIGLYGMLGRTSRVEYRPLGVVGIIAPWNFPWAIPAGEVVMALMAGNSVVLKPSELTPLVALKMADVFRRAGAEDGLLEVVTGDGSTGAALVEAGVDKIMFTGSVATGRRVAESAARRLTPVVLELGGKDAMIVLEDADLEVARARPCGARSPTRGRRARRSSAATSTNQWPNLRRARRRQDARTAAGQRLGRKYGCRCDVERAAAWASSRTRGRRARARRACGRGRPAARYGRRRARKFFINRPC